MMASNVSLASVGRRVSSKSPSFIIPTLTHMRSARAAAIYGSEYDNSIDRRSLMLSIATGMAFVGVDGGIVNADQGTTLLFQMLLIDDCIDDG